MRNKVFGVGLSRSGTSSLTLALNDMGLETVHSPHHYKEIERHVASTDSPIAVMFKEFDRLFPCSQFILTIRSKDKWLDSCEEFWRLMGRHFDESLFLTLLHRNLYGSSSFNRELYSAAYDRHHEEVHAYFTDRPSDLLVIKVGIDTGVMESLSSFLHMDMPYVDFPRAHSIKVIHERVCALLTSSLDVRQISDITYTSHEYLEWVESRVSEVSVVPLEDVKGSKLLEDMIFRAYQMFKDTRKVSELMSVDPLAIQYVVKSRIKRKSLARRAVSFSKRIFT
jgi:hypothetical protein